MKALKLLSIAAVIGSSLFFNSHFADAQIVTNKLPLLTYAETSVPVYAEPDGTKKGHIQMGTSLVMVKIIREDGWAYGSYKVGNRKKRSNGWFRMSDLQGYIDFENYTDSASRDTDAYRTRSSTYLVGRVSSNEEITVVAKRGEKLKIIFLADGNKYRMGWVDSTIFIKPEVSENDYNSSENDSYDDASSGDFEYNNYENSEMDSENTTIEVNATDKTSTVVNYNEESTTSESYDTEDNFDDGDFENADFESSELDNSEYEDENIESTEFDGKDSDKKTAENNESDGTDVNEENGENVSDDK